MAAEASEAFELKFAPIAPVTADGPEEVPEVPDTVVVHRTSANGPGGHPVYTDPTGIVRAEISDRGEVRMMATSAWQVPQRPIASHAVRSRGPRSGGSTAA